MVEEVAEPVSAARTFPQFLHAVADAYGDAPAVTLSGDSIPDDAVTFRELERRSAELARGLLAQGVGKGSRVGFICGNGPLFVVALAAIARIGAVAVPISTLLKADELVRVLRQSDVGGLIVQRRLLGHDYVERLCDALPELRTADGPAIRIARTPYLRWIVSTGADLPAAVRDLSMLNDAAQAIDEALLVEVEREVHPTDQLIEIYTSGSMALPKGVRHDHGPVIARTDFLRRMNPLTRGQVRQVALPLFWVGGLMIFLMPGLAAGSVAACTEGTPTSSRYAMGSVLAPEDLALIAVKPYWALGMSETLGPYSYGNEFRAEGYPVCAPIDNLSEGFELRVVDEDGLPVGDGGTGEIQVRGHALSPGLHKVEREGYYTADGFYHTGDMGRVEGKRVHFVGRNGDIIKAAGSNVSPAEVEMELQQLDGVHSAYVVGLPDAERGQLLAAAIVPREGATPDFEAIQKQLRQRLSPFKVPRAYIEIAREDVPMLFSNKVSRRLMQALVAVRLGRPAT